jgi:hypothetical protein
MGTPISFTLLANGLTAQFPGQVPGERLGSTPESVVMSQDTTTIACGGPNGNVAYVFRRSRVTDTWLLLQRALTAPIASVAPRFGHSLAVTSAGETLAISAPNNLGGRVYVYTNNTTISTIGFYQYYQALQGSGIVTTSNVPQFGYSVSITPSGSFMVVGAPGCNFSYVYSQSTSGLYFQEQRILAPVTTGNPRFGSSCKISSDGTYLLIGGRTTPNTGVTGTGMAFVYKKDTGTNNWTVVQNISTPVLTQPGFGATCDMSSDGTYAVIGFEYISSIIYKKGVATDSWDVLQGITTSDTFTSGYGPLTSISSNGNQVAIGNRRQRLSDAGAVLYYEKQASTDVWSLISTLQRPSVSLPSISQVSQYQGASGALSADGTYVVWGAPGLTSDSGTVYVAYRNYVKQMPSTNTVSLVSLESTPRLTVLLPKISTTTSQFAWLKDTSASRTIYSLLTVSTSGGDRLDSGALSTITTSNVGAAFDFVHDGVSRWYTLNYYAGK